VNQIVGSNELSTELAYTVRVTVSDSGGSWTVSRSVAGALFVLDALAGGKGISFGKAAELEGYADFAFKTRHRNPIYFDNNCEIYGINPNGDTVQAITPQNGNGNLVLGYGNYTDKSGNTNVYGYDVNIGVSNIAVADYYYRPYRRQGDSMTLTVRTAGYVTNSGNDVTFLIPFSVPIIGSPTVTVGSGQGFVLRQGTKYTHGSTASSYASPTSYSAAFVGQNSAYPFNGIVITAKFSDTTNVTNNDAIGIYWNGTITFT
jgi:hypothetical protein